MKPPKRMGFNVAHHPAGAFVLRVVGSTTQMFPNAKAAAEFLREAATWIEKKAHKLPEAPTAPRWWGWWARLRDAWKR